LLFEALGLATDVASFLAYIGFTLRSFVSFLFNSGDSSVQGSFDGSLLPKSIGFAVFRFGEAVWLENLLLHQTRLPRHELEVLRDDSHNSVLAHEHRTHKIFSNMA
jgi:hypothetical protein